MANQQGVVRDERATTSMTTLENGDAHVSVQSDEASNKSNSQDKDSETGKEGKKSSEGGFKYFLRVFTYNDSKGWVMNTIAFICMIAAGTALPLMDLIFGKFVNVFTDFATGKLSPGGYRDEVAKYSLIFVYLFVGKFVTTYIWTVLISLTAIRTTKQLRIDFVRQILRQEISFFDAPSSSISGQITTNGNLITNGISEKFGTSIQAISMFFTAFIVAFAVQWKLTFIVIGIVPLNLVVNIVAFTFDAIIETKIFKITSRSGSLAEEAFASIRTAHAFWAFPRLTKRYNAMLDESSKIGAKKSLLYALLFSFEYLIIFSGYGLAFWQGMRMYSNGEISQPGVVVTVIFAILIATQALTQLAPQSIAISKATGAAAELFAIIDRKSQIDSLSTEGRTISNFEGDIKLRNIRFAYPTRPDVEVLHSLDLDIPGNKQTALVGASGSGKSTIFGLVERWYNASQGQITLDGQPIEDLNLQWLRTQIRLVQQEPTLFSGTIYQNIVDGLTGTDMADLPDEEKRRLVKEACQSAYAHDFIEDLPNGYETWIGERGASLSGGQKQRIVIARSIISNPRVLLLDEATSALDPSAEKIVQKALNNVAKGRTMIIIAHRLSTIRDVDNIVVMAKGQVVEQGSHDELVALNGAYARLVKTQDLSKGGDDAQDSDEDDDVMKMQKAEDLDKVLTQASANGEAVLGADPSMQKQKMFGLIPGMYMMFREQPRLWKHLASIIFWSTLGGGTFPALAVLFAKTMEAFETMDVSRNNFFSLMFFVVALGNFVAYFAVGWAANITGQHIVRFYRAEIFKNTIRQDMTFFDNPVNGTGALVSRLSTEPTSLQELVSINFALILVTVVNVISSSILAIAYGWKLGLVLVFSVLPVLVGSGYVRIRMEFKSDEQMAERFATSSGTASEAVLGIRTISSLALERAVIERYSASVQNLAKEAAAGIGLKMIFYSFSQSVSLLGMALGFWYGGRLVSTGEYTTGQFYTVFTAIIFSGEAAALFFTFTTSVTKARVALNYIFQLRNTVIMNDPTAEVEKSDHDSASGSTEKGAAVDVNDVTFAYPLRPKLKVLRGIDVSIPSGKMIAFVGASGCGKSTMIALLERFYDPSTGELRMDGRDVKTRDRCLYRRDIALVQQEPVLYQGSIRENIALGSEVLEPTEESIIEACKQANIWDFISSLPEGLETPCGNQGLSLSGGQRQRIAIARALMRKPRLLLLDEATSALDTESEKVVKEALDKAAAGRTTVAVAHRLSTIRDANQIVVFGKGKVIEMGTHDRLVAKKGAYYEMVLGQSLDREAA